MIKEADSDKDGFINCQGRLHKFVLSSNDIEMYLRVLFHPVCWGDKQGQEEEKQGQCQQNKGGKWEEWFKQEWLSKNS